MTVTYNVRGARLTLGMLRELVATVPDEADDLGVAIICPPLNGSPVDPGEYSLSVTVEASR